MPVVSYCSHRSQDLQSAYAFLDRWSAQAQTRQQPQLVSLSFAIAPVDPLMVLAKLAPRRDRHLYMETPRLGESVVGFGATLFYQTSGPRRFAQVRRFIDHWQGRTRSYCEPGAAAMPGGGDWARFFCAFTFFAEPDRGSTTFPAATAMLPQWQVVQRGSQGVLTLNHLMTTQASPQALVDTLAAQLQAIDRLGLLGHGPCGAAGLGLPSQAQPDPEAGQRFKAAVDRALGHMACHPVQKIVLAHALDWVSPEPFEPLACLGRLRRRYPDCHTFSLSQGGDRTFIGASPERLLSLSQGHLVTDALAGSAPRGTTPQEDDRLAQGLLYNPKERGEHGLVVDFLARQLQGVGLRLSYQPLPQVLRLSNIQHLHTPMGATVPRHIHPLHIVEALHPTPAVAGVPTQAACDQILRFEDFDRGLYAAPLGWVGANGDSEFIVGIRSALIANSWARLYAGAGIVAGSDPDREWAEIKLKFRALGESLV
jgi:menaquinone-specific isochorismate synthase